MIYIWNDQKFNVKAYRTIYDNGSLHVYITDESGRFFLSLSSNTYYSKYIDSNEYAYVELNRLPDADRFIVYNHLGESTGSVRVIGRSKYYLYRFNIDNIKEKTLKF